MGQVEFWHSLRERFLSLSTAESEKLMVRYEPGKGILWAFEGPAYYEREFQALARDGAYLLTQKRGRYAWIDWLEALRQAGIYRNPQRNETPTWKQPRADAPSAPSVNRRRSIYLGLPKDAPCIIEQPYKNSALFCLERATEVRETHQATNSPLGSTDVSADLYSATEPDLSCYAAEQDECDESLDSAVEESTVADRRAAFVRPILDKKGWSILRWATESDVDFHTANDYLKGTTRPYPSTRKQLAEGLGVDVGELPV